MHPILTVLRFGEFELPIGTYGALVALGMVMTAFVVVRQAHRAGIDAGDAMAVCGYVAVGSLLGAHLLFTFVEVVNGRPALDALREPGLVFYGAPLGGGLAFVLASRGFGLPPLRFLDAAVGAIPVGHALGRMGCFFAGCCFGGASSGLGVTHPMALEPHLHAPITRHPVQLYEAAGLLALALLFARPAQRLGDGARFATYFLGYAALRFGLEFFRGDAVRGVSASGISTSQWVALVTGAAALAHLVRVAARRRHALAGSGAA